MTIIYLPDRLPGTVDLPTRPRVLSDPWASRPSRRTEDRPAIGDLHGISARKVYPPSPLLTTVVGSYPTFSPLSLTAGAVRDGYSLWHCLFPLVRDPAVHRCVALCCPDFPPYAFGVQRWSGHGVQVYGDHCLPSTKVKDRPRMPVSYSRVSNGGVFQWLRSRRGDGTG